MTPNRVRLAKFNLDRREESGDEGEAIKCRTAALTVAVAASFGCFTIAAHAQSSVEIYGVLDTGLDYVSNVGGKRQFSFGSGVMAPNLFGFRGKEDLGEGCRRRS